MKFLKSKENIQKLEINKTQQVNYNPNTQNGDKKEIFNPIVVPIHDKGNLTNSKSNMNNLTNVNQDNLNKEDKPEIHWIRTLPLNPDVGYTGDGKQWIRYDSFLPIHDNHSNLDQKSIKDDKPRIIRIDTLPLNPDVGFSNDGSLWIAYDDFLPIHENGKNKNLKSVKKDDKPLIVRIKTLPMKPDIGLTSNLKLWIGYSVACNSNNHFKGLNSMTDIDKPRIVEIHTWHMKPDIGYSDDKKLWIRYDDFLPTNDDSLKLTKREQKKIKKVLKIIK